MGPFSGRPDTSRRAAKSGNPAMASRCKPTMPLGVPAYGARRSRPPTTVTIGPVTNRTTFSTTLRMRAAAGTPDGAAAAAPASTTGAAATPDKPAAAKRSTTAPAAAHGAGQPLDRGH